MSKKTLRVWGGRQPGTDGHGRFARNLGQASQPQVGPPLVLAAGLMAMSPFGPANAEPAGDAAAGKAKAGLCAACHGLEGLSANPLWPNLAGQHPAYLAAQIRAYRDGKREEITMQPFVQDLTDQDVEDLAAWYASLSPCP